MQGQLPQHRYGRPALAISEATATTVLRPELASHQGRPSTPPPASWSSKVCSDERRNIAHAAARQRSAIDASEPQRFTSLPAAIHLDIPTNQLKPSRKRLPRARFRLGKRRSKINRRHRDPHSGRAARLLELHRRGQRCSPPRMQLRKPRRLTAKLKVNLAVVDLVHERHARSKCSRAEVDEGRSARPLSGLRHLKRRRAERQVHER
jgi:hypothetical protein